MAWVMFKVVDACGAEFLHTGSDESYERRFREHAAWWVKHATRPAAHKDTDSAGNRLRQPVKPCRVVIERTA